MADVDKVLSTVEKLLRLAAPTSGAPQPERESAALEAARLISENNLVVREPDKRRRRRSPMDDFMHGDEVEIRTSAWVLNVANDHCSCSACAGLIAPRDIVWIRVIPGVGVEYRHKYAPCGVV